MKSTDRSTRLGAKAEAKRIVLELEQERLLDDREKKPISKKITLGEVLAIYEERALWVQRRRENTQALRRIARLAFGKEDDATDRLDAREVFTAETVRSWLKALLDVDHLDYRSREGNVTAESTFRHARSVVSAKCWHADYGEIYQGIQLPDLQGFRSARIPRVEKGSARFRPFSRAALQAIDKFGASLADESRDLWLAFLFVRLMGLRNSEIFAMRRHWIEEFGDKHVLAIRARPAEGFQPKSANSVRILQLPERLFIEVENLNPDTLIFAPDLKPTPRHDLLYRELSEKLRPYTEGRNKTLYELRKQFGSEVARAKGLAVAAAALGNSEHVAREHYSYLLEDVVTSVDLTSLGLD
ncbi:MAG: hypothetical protein AAF236_06995 [Verrucomicrobiota bacterium]